MSNNKHDEVKQMAMAGMGTSQIAQELGVTPTYVRQILREAGIPSQRAQSALTEDAEEQLVARVLAGEAISALVQAFAINYNQFYSIMRRHDVDLTAVRTTRTDDRNLRMETAISLYQSGAPLWEIGQTTGIASSMLNQELHRRNIPLRRK